MLHQIGVGTLGPVFRTYEPERDRLVAVKAFRLDITPETAQALADELAAICERMLFHPSVVEPLAAGVEGTAAYRAEEYVAAESLDVLMRQHAPASIETVLLLVTQLSGAIDFARAAGVGHGGLHPRDVFLTPEGEARATGFGVAEALERVGLRAPVRRPYTAPERIAAGSWSTPADVFSLAAIAYELLTGRRPAGLGRELGPLSAGTPNPWMDAVHAVFARAMDQDPDARYQSALAFASDLKAAVHGEQAPDASALAAFAATGREESVAPAVAPVAAAGAWEREAAAEPMPAWTDQPSSADGEPEEPPDLLRELPPGPDLVLRGAREQEQDEEERARYEAEDTTPESPREVVDGQDAFLLHAAGAAAAPGEPMVERFHEIGSGVDVRALEDDEVIPAEAAVPLMAPEPLLESGADAGPRTLDARERGTPRVTPGVAVPAWHDEPAGRRSAWPIAALLVLAVLAGFGGGYALWGRGSSPGPAPGDAGTSGSTPGVAAGGREWSEAPVAPASADAPAAEPGGSTAASAAPPASPAAAPPSEARPATGRLLVRSTPSGAGVTIDGTWRGRTPLTLDDLPLSTYQVRVVQPGFAPATRAVALSAEEPEGTIAVRLEREVPARPARTAKPAPPPARTAKPAPAARTATPSSAASPAGFTGSIYVDSRPRGARVSINGKPVGATPLRIPEMRIGTHVVRMELPDHRIWTSTARVAAGQEARVTGSLEPIQ